MQELVPTTWVNLVYVKTYEDFIMRDEALESKINLVVGTVGGRNIITSTFKASTKHRGCRFGA